MKKPTNSSRNKLVRCPVAVIAELLNLSVRRIQQLAERRIIPKATKGKYDLIGCVQGYAEFLQRQIPNDEVVKTQKSLLEEKLRKIKHENDTAEEKVIGIDEARTITNEIREVTKFYTDSIPDKLANEIAKIDEPAIIKKMLLEEIRGAQRQIADHFSHSTCGE